ALPPHPFVAATQAYVHMMETSNDQTLVMTGESGSAKSRVAREVVNHLIYLSSQLTGERVGIYREIAAVQEILECLGSARVPTNLNGSRHGTHWQLLWDEEFQLAGLLVQLMGLKTQRVMQVPEDERNFHVFHALMAGANSEEKS
ncbi:P-loop containing nucleoside triphosphate hydrolase protein, partial [Caulochytrium protostelioides]